MKVTANFPFNVDTWKNNKYESNETAFSCLSGIFDLAYQRGERDPCVVRLPRSEHTDLLHLLLIGWRRGAAACLPK